MDKKYNILMDFVYDGIKYVLYTDDTYTDKGEFNIYSAGVDSEGNYFKPYDADVDLVIKAMIENYKKKIEDGNI